MPQPPAETPLHLQNLVITGFRGIRELAIDRLGRVTLLAGKNGVGKTTVLEAVQVYAGRGDYSVLSGLLRERDELTDDDGGDRKIAIPDFTALFHGRDARGGRITVGSPDIVGKTLTLEDVALDDELGVLVDQVSPDIGGNGSVRGLRADFKGAKHFLPVVSVPQGRGARRVFARVPLELARAFRRFSDDSSDSTRIPCQVVGPGPLENHEIAPLWGNIALTDYETLVEEALQLVMGDQVQRVAIVGYSRRGHSPPKAIVKLKGRSHPVPLKSLGDGAVRLFGLALALANSPNGLLLIDEVENGLHHSLQKAFWTIVLRTAQVNNVQVLATTHSFDCVQGFAEAANEITEVDCALVRVTRREDETWAVEYSEEDLRIAAEQGIEVR